MAPAFDPDRLPDGLRSLVARALTDVDGCEQAIAALERHVETGGGPDARVALALLTFEEAAQLVVSQLGPAAERALSLIEEAVQQGAPETGGLVHLRRICRDTLQRERSRERDLIARVMFGNAEPAEVALLAHRVLVERRDDGLAAALLRRAADLADGG